MKAKFVKSLIDTGSAARDYIRLVKNASSRAIKGMDQSHGREAKEILENIRELDDSSYGLDIDITGQNLIDQMGRDLEDMGLIPYFFSNAAREAREGISAGSHIRIPDDDRKFRVVSISRRNGSVRIRDASGNEYLVPWQLPQPWRE
jgi:hypothetical protein